MIQTKKYTMKKSLLKLTLGFVALTFGISSFAQTYTFTPCGATGRFGPNQGQVNTAYTSTTLQGAVTINTQGIQEWTVPATGNYTITVTGAQGGDNIGNYPGGLGASMSGEFSLTQGTVLKIAVGQAGENTTTTSNSASGGGGGSFVTDNANTPIIIAGGGGGRRATTPAGPQPLSQGIITTAGQDGYNAVGTGGTAGNGGSNTEPTGQGSGGPGAGLLTNGGPCGTCSATSIGIAFVNGAMGGSKNGNASTDGGFGGGGGGCWCYRGSPGGGGGYSGGGTGMNVNGNGGGGSYNSGINKVDSTGANAGDGQVIITSLCTTSQPAAAIAAFTQDSICVNDPAITLTSGTPVGGTYSGTGVSGSTFNPTTAGVGTHYVVYSNTDSCSVTTMDSTMIVVQPCGVGIDENSSLSGVKIFPNPTSGLVTINLGNHNGTVNYSVSTVEGKIVSSKNNVNTTNINIDLTNESNGVYILKIEDATSSKTYKLLKE